RRGPVPASRTARSRALRDRWRCAAGLRDDAQALSDRRFESSSPPRQSQAFKPAQEKRNRLAAAGAEHRDSQPGEQLPDTLKTAAESLGSQLLNQQGISDSCCFALDSRILIPLFRQRQAGRPGADYYHLVMPSERDANRATERLQL